MQYTSVVTGASYGIGESIAKKLLSKGFKVYGISRTPPKSEHSNFTWLQGDLTKTSVIKSLSDHISEMSIDVLINNAGTAINEKVLEYKDKNFQKIFGLNFVAPIKLTLALLPKLRDGIIINISSLSDRFPGGLYGSSKAALNNYFETIAAQCQDLKVISVLPSYVDTPLLRKLHRSDPNFDWSMTNQPDQTANFINFFIDNPTSLESGSRVVVVPRTRYDSDYDPEKLWIFVTDTGKLTRLNKKWLSTIKKLWSLVPLGESVKSFVKSFLTNLSK